ncbi:vacuolar alkaline phosphatase, partial [Linderina macrospora]
MKISVVSILSLAIAAVSAMPANDNSDNGAYSAYGYGHGHSKKPANKNLIMIVSDGFGVASETLARTYVQQIDRKPYEWLSTLDELLVGTSRTKASDSLVTDSAAGATAFSCGKKSYNGAIGVTDDEKPCGTVLEAAKLQGYKTGLVTTSRITHATPASFAAHVVDRDMEGLIAQHEIGDNTLGNKVDLMFGGGLCFFQPNTTKGSC